jgi:hypothetical protein
MADYEHIENPYNNNCDRSIRSEMPDSPDDPVRDGGSMKDVWISTFIRSTNWKPIYVGFNISGETGDAEFQRLRSKDLTVFANDPSGTQGGIYVYLDQEHMTMNIRPDGRIILTPVNGSSASVDITFPANGYAAGFQMSDQGAMINIQAPLGNYAKKGIQMLLDGNLAGGDTIGIDMSVDGGNGGGRGFAFKFRGTPGGANVVWATSVAGTQNRVIKVLIDGTPYYIPCYSSYT